MPIASRVSAAQVYSGGHQRVRSAKAANAAWAGTGTVTAWRIGSSAGSVVTGTPQPDGRSCTVQPLPSGSLKNTNEFQGPPGPSTRSEPS